MSVGEETSRRRAEPQLAVRIVPPTKQLLGGRDPAGVVATSIEEAEHDVAVLIGLTRARTVTGWTPSADAVRVAKPGSAGMVHAPWRARRRR